MPSSHDALADQVLGYDAAAVATLADQPVSWQDKGLPPAVWGQSVAEVIAAGLRLSQLPTPVFTLDAAGLRHNVDTLARWSRDHGVELAPHGKTTMAPALWAAQLDAGAWGITLANTFQLGVARAYGVRRVVIANSVISPLQLRWIAGELAADPTFEVFTWADSVRTVDLMTAALEDRYAIDGPGGVGDRNAGGDGAGELAMVGDEGAAGQRNALGEARGGPGRRLDVLVEVGGAGGRTGARDLDTAVAVARAIAAAPGLRLAGVAGYEGAIAHGSDEEELAHVRSYLGELAAVHVRLVEEGLYEEGLVPIVSAGGSAYFEQVAAVLAPLAADGARGGLRSGAYIAHDDGYYRTASPLGAHPRTGGDRLVPAMHAWVRITSQPEPGLALFDAGRRDLPFDAGLPEPQLIRPRTPDGPVLPAVGMTVTKLNDQHGFLRFDPAGSPPVVIGDELRLGLSHPCTAFDKWRLIPVVDDADAPDPQLVDLVRTFF